MTRYYKNLNVRLNCRFSDETGNYIKTLSKWLNCSESEVVRLCVRVFLKEHTDFKVSDYEDR